MVRALRDARDGALTAAADSPDTLVIGIDGGHLTPLDAHSDRLKAGTRWIESDTTCEVRQ